MEGRLYGLDALRGVAAILVLLFHANATFGNLSIFSSAYLAVDFFFMLSGYVMARTYEPQMAAGLSAHNFLRKRVKRLWGTVAIGTLVGFAYFTLWAEVPLTEAVPPLLLMLCFLPAPSGWTLFPLNIPAWSITFELIANAVHAVSLRRWSTKALAIFAFANLAITAMAFARYGQFQSGILPAYLAGNLTRVLAAYSIGIVLFRIMRDRSPLSVPALVPTLLLTGVLMVGVFVRSIAFDVLFVALICPLLIAMGLGRALPFSSAIGALSFPLYAVHQPILHWIKMVGGSASIACVIALLAGAALAWFVSDKPRNRWNESQQLSADTG